MNLSTRLFICLIVTLPSTLRADVRLLSIFSEHLVLMKAASVPVWGKANAGEHIRVTMAGKIAETDADAAGRWKVALILKDSAPGPFELIVEGGNRIVIPDAVVGEVWLASGQSNMELPLRVTTDADSEIGKSANPFLRQFLVKKAGAKLPADDCEGHWTIASPETSGEFTAIGYYFGKKLQQERKLPVGIIHSSHGGTYIEPWTLAEALDQIATFKTTSAALRKSTEEYPKLKSQFAADFTAWLKEHQREDQPCPHPAAVRYAWADNPTCNLSNGAGLPASPFRTDTFLATTINEHF